jgi:dihydroorotate dehydrogenase (NAD+) catalytic subunit
MAVRLTRPGKNSLVINTPVMNAAGTLGFGDEYRDLFNYEKLGALVTNPVTYAPWGPAHGTHVVPLDGGILVHTGLPNPGIRKVIEQNRGAWNRMLPAVIVHVVINNPEEVRRVLELLEEEDTVAGIEFGMNDSTTASEAEWNIRSALNYTDKPTLVRLPFGASHDFAKAVINGGAGGLVVCAPPRGTARDRSGRLTTGRLYGPMIKPLVLRLVGQMARIVDVPVIGAGGIHSPEDARDFLDAGAVAVQVDSATWVSPKIIELIARDLGGLVLTQPAGALADEWYPGMGLTAVQRPVEDDETQSETHRRKKP